MYLLEAKPLSIFNCIVFSSLDIASSFVRATMTPYKKVLLSLIAYSHIVLINVDFSECKFVLLPLRYASLSIFINFMPALSPGEI